MEKFVSELRVRMSAKDAHYGGNLVDGAHMLHLFGDVATDAYYANAVTWAVANEITNGTGGNTFSPDVVVSRAQAVTFLYRELA